MKHLQGHGVPDVAGADLEGFPALAELALDLRWSWDHRADGVWRQLDPTLWELTRNAWVILQTVSREHLARLLGGPSFRTPGEAPVRAQRGAREEPRWFQRLHPQTPLAQVAYFSMEFMLSEALPIYSG